MKEELLVISAGLLLRDRRSAENVKHAPCLCGGAHPCGKCHLVSLTSSEARDTDLIFENAVTSESRGGHS